MSRTTVLSATTLAVLTAFAAPVIAEEPTRYALFAVENKTDITIHYSVRWGTYGTSKGYTVKPGEVYRHWIELDQPGKNEGPLPHVGFACDLRPGKYDFADPELDAYCVSRTDLKYAKRYSFQKANGGKRLELYED